MERKAPAAPVAAAKSPVGHSKVGTVVKASALAVAPSESPLQALVQYILEQQKQHAPVHTRAFCFVVSSNDIGKK